jgi:hypothetical protein
MAIVAMARRNSGRVAVQKFSSLLRRGRQGRFGTKITLESWISGVLSNPEFAGEVAAK